MDKRNQSLSIVILTYGRRKFVDKVLDFLQHDDRIKDIVVVCNAGFFLKPEGIRKKIHIINSEKNLGSAEGYRIGFSKALQLTNRFVWVLDDDNLPEKGALDNLFNCWTFFKLDQKLMCALQCYRTSQFSYKKIFDRKTLNLLPIPNSFLGFHIKRIFKIILNRIKPSLYSKTIMVKKLYPSNAGFYGGLFLETKTLGKTPMPDKKYFIYVDDLEFTNNIVKSGGHIFVATSSVINDLDFSIDIQAKGKFFYHPILEFSTNMKAFFYTRNIYFFTKRYQLNNNFAYRVNCITFFLLIKILSIINRRSYRFKVMLAGIRAGEKWYVEETKGLSIVQ